jgi:hypothetical protein
MANKEPFHLTLSASEIDAALLAAKNAVTYEPQTVPPEKQAQARANMNAADAEVVGNIEAALDAILAIQNELIGGDGA